MGKRKLLQPLVDLANADQVVRVTFASNRETKGRDVIVTCKDGVEVTFPLDTLRNSDKVPTFQLSSIHVRHWKLRSWRDAQQGAKKLLDLLSRNDAGAIDTVESEVNARGLGVRLYSPNPRTRLKSTREASQRNSGSVGILVPTAVRGRDLPYAIVALARCAPTDQGDSVADRIRRCEQCAKFFLLETRKDARFCSGRCHDRWHNEKRRSEREFRVHIAPGVHRTRRIRTKEKNGSQNSR